MKIIWFCGCSEGGWRSPGILERPSPSRSWTTLENCAQEKARLLCTRTITHLGYMSVSGGQVGAYDQEGYTVRKMLSGCWQRSVSWPEWECLFYGMWICTFLFIYFSVCLLLTSLIQGCWEGETTLQCSPLCIVYGMYFFSFFCILGCGSFGDITAEVGIQVPLVCFPHHSFWHG